MQLFGAQISIVRKFRESKAQKVWAVVAGALAFAAGAGYIAVFGAATGNVTLDSSTPGTIEDPASIEVIVNSTPGKNEALRIGTCLIEFSDDAATVDNTDCDDQYAIVGTNSLTANQVADKLDLLTNLTDIDVGDLTTSAGQANTTVFTANAVGDGEIYFKESSIIEKAVLADSEVVVDGNLAVYNGTDGWHIKDGDVNIDRVRNLLSTAWLSGGTISINFDNTKFDVSAGTGIVVDNSDPLNPATAMVLYGPFTAVTPDFLATDSTTILSINSAGSLIQRNHLSTNEELRVAFDLGALSHPDNTTISDITNFSSTTPHDLALWGADFFNAVNVINEGNVISANGANLKIDRSAGSVFATGIALKVDSDNPNSINTFACSPCDFFLTWQDGLGGWNSSSTTTDLVPGSWDDGTGGTGTPDGTTQDWQFQIFRVYYAADADLTGIQFGQTLFNNQTAAINNITSESFDRNPLFDGFAYLGAIVAKGDATDLSDVDQVFFQQGIIFNRFDLGASKVNEGVNNLARFADGATTDTPDVDVTSNGSIVTLSVERLGGGDLVIQIGGRNHTLVATPTPATIELTAGTDIDEATNFVYAIADTPTTVILAKDPSGFPTDQTFAPIGTYEIQSASGVQQDGCYKCHSWTDHIANQQGHLYDLNRRTRLQFAEWQNGVEPTLTIDTGPTPDDVWFSNTSGQVDQVHPHVFPALDMETSDPIWVRNDPGGANNRITNLNTITVDALGNSINNRYFSTVVYGVVSEKEADCKIWLNLPLCSSAVLGDMEAVDTCAVYSLPTKYKGTAFLIARLLMRKSGDNWTLVKVDNITELKPSTSPAGGVGGAGVTTFAALTDTPSSYIGQALNLLRVNAGETLLEFFDKATDWLSQYALLAGRSGGQTLYGGTAASNNLVLNSTSNATKGQIQIGSTAYIDEVNNRVGIGTNSPFGTFNVSGNTTTVPTGLFGGFNIQSFEDDNGFLFQNAYFDGSDLRLIEDGFAAGIQMNDGVIDLRNTAAAGNAGDIPTMERRLRILANGNVGIGTTSPLGKLHVVNQAGGNWFQRFSDTSFAAATNILAKARNTEASPNILQDGDKIGTLGYLGYDGNSWMTNPFSATIIAEVDGTPGTGDVPGALYFQTKPASGTLAERMRITSDGNVGIGTTTPLVGVHVVRAGNADFRLERTGATASIATITAASGQVIMGASNAPGRVGFVYNNSWVFRYDGSNIWTRDGWDVGIGTTAPSFKLDVNGTLGAALTGSTGGSDTRYNTTTNEIFYDTSSRRYKENISAIEPSESDWFYQIDWKCWDDIETGRHECGVIAEELEAIAPWLINYKLYKYTGSEIVGTVIPQEDIDNTWADYEDFEKTYLNISDCWTDESREVHQHYLEYEVENEEGEIIIEYEWVKTIRLPEAPDESQLMAHVGAKVKELKEEWDKFLNPAEKTITGGEITADTGTYLLIAEAGADDDLITIHSCDADNKRGKLEIMLSSNSLGSVTLHDNDGNLRLKGENGDFTLNHPDDFFVLRCNGENWIEQERNDISASLYTLK